MWGAREQRFPEHTPATREYYLLRSIFEEHFPSPSALATVPKARRNPKTMNPRNLDTLKNSALHVPTRCLEVFR